MNRILYRLLASLARLAVRSGRSKDFEIIVLRHQLTVLRRPNNKTELTDDDRSLLAAIAAALPRPRRAGWLVTPDTLRRELLDRTIVWNQHQLERLVVDYIDHYNTHRPHRSLDQKPPRPETRIRVAPPPTRIARRSRCGGLITEYRNAA